MKTLIDDQDEKIETPVTETIEPTETKKSGLNKGLIWALIGLVVMLTIFYLTNLYKKNENTSI
jgi:uncharacterized membrane protein YjfL (UPF0719 family)